MKEIRALLLAAGQGTRLKPLTDLWPKCLMPIGNRPLLEYWLYYIQRANIKNVLVNLHHHAAEVNQFLQRDIYSKWIQSVYEPELLGTAGTLIKNRSFFMDCTTLLIHADNWTNIGLEDFIKFHQRNRPKNCLVTMMTFESENTETCGVVETDDNSVVIAFHEKVKNPPGRIANAAVYLIEPEVLEWLDKHPSISDFSTEVIPSFVGRICTWHNPGAYRDIGKLDSLLSAQNDKKPSMPRAYDLWMEQFQKNPVQQQLKSV